MLVYQFAKNKSISFSGCTLQFFVFCICPYSESLLLAVMAYDQYKAISNPLFHVVSISSRVCSLLMAGVYLVGMTDALIHTTLAFHLCFCGSNEINHFSCDLPLLFFFFFSPVLLRYTGQWIRDIPCFGFYWTEYYFRSPCLLFLYHPFSLDPLCWREIQNFFHLHLPLYCCGDFPGNCVLFVFQAKFILIF